MLNRVYIGAESGSNTTPSDETILSWLRECNIDGATIIRATGVWKNRLEPCVIVELAGEYRKAQSLARLAQVEWNQRSVLVVSLDSSEEFIYAHPQTSPYPFRYAI